MTTVTINDSRKATLCSRGQREWFELHGFDWKDFLKNGIAAEKLIATGDAMALAAVKAAELREKNGQ